MSEMPQELLEKITNDLDPVSIVCLGITCKKMHTFCRQPAAFMPSLEATVSMDTVGIPKPLWRLLEKFMAGRLYAGHYGKEKFVNIAMYNLARDDYWERYPQRPYDPTEPSPWCRAGGEAVDVGEASKQLAKEHGPIQASVDDWERHNIRDVPRYVPGNPRAYVDRVRDWAPDIGGLGGVVLRAIRGNGGKWHNRLRDASPNQPYAQGSVLTMSEKALGKQKATRSQ